MISFRSKLKSRNRDWHLFSFRSAQFDYPSFIIISANQIVEVLVIMLPLTHYVLEGPFQGTKWQVFSIENEIRNRAMMGNGR